MGGLEEGEVTRKNEGWRKKEDEGHLQERKKGGSAERDLKSRNCNNRPWGRCSFCSHFAFPTHLPANMRETEEQSC